MFEVADLDDDSLILPFLESDRRWAAYALCDLDEPYRRDSRFIGARRDGEAQALLVLYAPPGLSVVLPFGSPQGVHAIVSSVPDLPRHALLVSLEDSFPVLAEHYTVSQERRMLRMTVEAAHLVSAPSHDAAVRRLTSDDLPHLTKLYSRMAEAAFHASMLADGIYFGAIVDGALVAVAGTHTIAPRFGIGTIGGVYTDPAYRGRGLATTLTGAVARALIGAGMTLLALNVREDNVPAIAAYRRLGFTVRNTFWEANGEART